MRASDLLRHRVYTAAGECLGVVSDFHVVQDGPLVAGVQNAFRVDRLVVGRGGFADRLGYVRGEVQGPWLLSVIFHRLERGAKLVRIEDIDRWDDEDVIVLRAGAEIGSHNFA